MASVKEPLVLTRLSFSTGHANEEKTRGKELFFRRSALILPFPSTHSAQEAEFESVEGDVGAWVTVMGEVIT